MKPHWLLPIALLMAPACHPQAGQVAANTCIDPSKINPDAICTMQYAPVCGCDGKTYANPCVATNAGVRTFTEGPCPAARPK